MMESQIEYQKYDKYTATITFRLDSNVIAKLKESARCEKSTVNALVNKLLLQAVEWSIIAAKSRWVPAEGQ